MTVIKVGSVPLLQHAFFGLFFCMLFFAKEKLAAGKIEPVETLTL